MACCKVYSLLQAHSGETVSVHSVTGDLAMRARLNALGFTPGTPVFLCTDGRSDGCRKVIVRNCPLILDELAASSVMLEKV